MPDFRHTAGGGLNESRVGFGIADLDVALTFMNVADTSGIVETKQRNYRNARTAYDSGFRPEVLTGRSSGVSKRVLS